MHALTVAQPWAWAIIHLEKIENRGWRFPEELLGERIAIHAGKTVDLAAAQFLWDNFGVEVPDGLPLGALIGTTRLVGLLEYRERREGGGEHVVIHRHRPGFAVNAERLKWLMPGRPGKRAYGWVGAEARPLREPIAARGNQGLWPLTADQLAVVNLAEAAP